ncbi:MAG: Spy/CpxP family protein refolding chaperone [Polyangiales bacterium]|jgi:Spy/CpxP family protein refolding chaperone
MSGLFDDVVPARREMKRAMKEIFSKALSEDVFDEDAVRKSIGEQEDRIVGLRESLIATLGRVHEALDEEQRAQLAAFAARRMAPSMGGPYR